MDNGEATPGSGATLKRAVLMGASALTAILSVSTVAVAVTSAEFAGLAWILTITFFLSSAIFAIIYRRATLRFHTATNRPEDKNQLSVSTDKVRSQAEDLFRNLSAAQAVLFHDLVTNPRLHVERVTEHVKPLSRAILVRNTQTINIPRQAATEHQVLPIFRQVKDQLGAGLRFHGSSGERVSSVPQLTTLAYAAAVVRFLVWSVSESALQRYVAHLESFALDAFTSIPGDSAKSFVLGQSFTESMLELGTEIASGSEPVSKDGTEEDGYSEYPLLLAVALITHFAANRFVCVEYAPTDPTPSVLGTRVRYTMEVRILANVAKSRQTRFWTRNLDSFADATRRWFGIRPGIVFFSLSNADRAGSYHLEVEGPAGTYLGRQRIKDPLTNHTVSTEEMNYSMAPRQGQRHSHLYVHRGNGFGDLVIENNFFERMPGSMGSATWSAFGAAVLVWLCSFVAVNRDNPGLELAATVDLVAILLAFPVVMALWAGFDKQQSILGDVMIARLSKLATIILAVTAACTYVAGPLPGVPAVTQWAVITGFITLVALGSAMSWLIRANTHDHFIANQNN